jgi:hypothetical protein
MHEGFAGLTRVIEELDGLLAARGIAYADLIGRAADALHGYGEQPARPGRWRDVVPHETLAAG